MASMSAGIDPRRPLAASPVLDQAGPPWDGQAGMVSALAALDGPRARRTPRARPAPCAPREGRRAGGGGVLGWGPPLGRWLPLTRPKFEKSSEPCKVWCHLAT
jgi:hypothetical protein